MATGRSPIKVPCENEDLPEKGNAPDFDEDTLQGELCWASASVIVRTFFYFTSFKRIYYTLYDYSKIYLASHDSLLQLQYAVHLEDL